MIKFSHIDIVGMRQFDLAWIAINNAIEPIMPPFYRKPDPKKRIIE